MFIDGRCLQMQQNACRHAKKVALLIENSRPIPTKKGPKSHREPWFDDELKNLKSQLRKLSRWLCKFPCNQTLRHRLFERKRDYRHKIRVKKQEFIKYINKSIEDETSISWSNLQGVKNFHEKRNDLDMYDMVNFIEFFTTLYQTKPYQLVPYTSLKLNVHLKTS